MHTFQNMLTIIGACAFVYFAVRVGVTAVDFYKDWRTGWTRWNSEKHLRIISRLSFWPDVERMVKACQDSGEIPFDQPVALDLEKLPAKDHEKLVGIKDHAAAVEHQLTLLFARENVADKMEVRRKGNLLYICSHSW